MSQKSYGSWLKLLRGAAEDSIFNELSVMV